MSTQNAHTERRELMRKRAAAMAVQDWKTANDITTALSNLPMKGVPSLTAKDIAKWNARKS